MTGVQTCALPILDGYKTLKEGDYVTFNLVETPKGLQAKNVETTRKCMVN